MEEALTTILSSVAGGRRYWVSAPQSLSTRPYIIMLRVSGNRDYAMSGPTGYVQSRIQVDIYDESYGGAKTVARAVRDAVSGFAGTIGGVHIQRISVESERDLPADDVGEITELFRTSIDLMIHHDE